MLTEINGEGYKSVIPRVVVSKAVPTTALESFFKTIVAKKTYNINAKMLIRGFVMPLLFVCLVINWDFLAKTN